MRYLHSKIIKPRRQEEQRPSNIDPLNPAGPADREEAKKQQLDPVANKDQIALNLKSQQNQLKIALVT